MPHRPSATVLFLLLVLPLAACEREPLPPAATPSPDDLASPAGSATAPAADAALPAEFIVSTNEPFWQARVEGDAVVLDGPDVDGRRFAVTSAEDAEGARLVHASDAAGTLSVTLRPGPCEDSMSGATFPLAAELTIDGIGPSAGCARPAGTPPPGEPGR